MADNVTDRQLPFSPAPVPFVVHLTGPGGLPLSSFDLRFKELVAEPARTALRLTQCDE